MTGMLYEKLTVISRAPNDSGGNARWNALCDCGRQIIVSGREMRSGRKKDCGCSRRKAYTVDKLCEFCGKPVMKKENRFCCYSCSARARVQVQKIEVDESFNWKKTSGNRWKCRFGFKNISCTDRDCANCGWNPEVAQKRNEEIRQKMEVAAV